jgi:DNA-binding beta-propeller fold protein YncE
MKRNIYAAAALLALLVSLSLVPPRFVRAAAAQNGKHSSALPTFVVDPFWPKPLPKNLILGQLAGVDVDSHDHVWIISRPRTLTDDEKGAALNPPTSECCVPAPPVIEFDAAGNYLQGWGGPGPGYQWPENEHGIFVDYKGNVWIGGNTTSSTYQPPHTDNQILKFTYDGKFLLQIGHADTSSGSNDTENLNRPAQIFVYPKTNEVFVADGYQNRRVIVFDADTGAYKRHWGAYGNRPDDAAPRTGTFDGPGEPQFTLVHGVRISNDNLVYVSDRQNNRIQVFTIDGKFIKEGFIARRTLDDRGTSFEVAFSPDKAQKYLYVPDGANYKIRILDRDTLQMLGSFGRMGPYAGQWHWLHSIATDSKGNIYSAESRGNRVQKFVFKGFAPQPVR